MKYKASGGGGGGGGKHKNQFALTMNLKSDSREYWISVGLYISWNVSGWNLSVWVHITKRETE